MSHTITRPGRFSRLAAGLTVAAAATAMTLLGAAPAHAQPNVILRQDGRDDHDITGTVPDDIATTSAATAPSSVPGRSGIAIAAGTGCQTFDPRRTAPE